MPDGISARMEEAFKRLRDKGVLSRVKSYEFGTQFAIEWCRGMKYEEASKLASILLKHKIEDADVPSLPDEIMKKAGADWKERNPKEQLEDFGFRLGFYVQVLKVVCNFWDERAEKVLGEG